MKVYLDVEIDQRFISLETLKEIISLLPGTKLVQCWDEDKFWETFQKIESQGDENDIK